MSQSGAPTPEGRNITGGEQEARQMRGRLQMVRAGVTSFALLGGISCYVLLLQFHLVSPSSALVIGLVFALLVRVAAGSLARDWMQQQRTLRDGNSADSTRSSVTDATRSSGRRS